MPDVRDRGCGRARAWASLDLDGELSQLERALLAAHLARCDACARHVADVRAATHALRAAELERPPRPVAVQAGRRRRGASLAVRVALAATLAALAGGLGVLAGSIGGSDGSPPPTVNSDIALRAPSVDDAHDRGRGRLPSEPLEDTRRVPAPGRLGGV
jgi:anti-sigma factor RsiW